MNWLTRTLFEIRPREVNFARRGARIDPEQSVGLGQISESLRVGFNMTLADDRLEDLTERIARVVEPQCVGFAHEGAGMCLAFLDWMHDRERVPRFFEKCAGGYDVFVTLGVGFALARAPWVRGGVEARAARFPTSFDGMVLNGYGFHEACFKSGGALDLTPVPSAFSSDARRCFDHGLGRALWFMCGGSPARITASIERFERPRRPDLWAGLGTACAYAGRAYADPGEYAEMLGRFDPAPGLDRESFNIGVVLAAELVRRTGHPNRWVSQATQKFLGLNDVEAGAVSARAWAVAHREPRTSPYSNYSRYAESITRELSLVQARAASPLQA
jgi:hypothetical protein